MKDKDIGIEMQYEILHERTWNYNGLLWKNILAFGAAFLGIAQITAVETWGTHESVVCYLGSTILVVLGIFQFVLVNGLKRTVDSARHMEEKYSLELITNRMENGFGVKFAYYVASAGMLGIGITIIILGYKCHG